MGVETSPYFNHDLTIDSKIRDRIQRKFHNLGFSSRIQELIARKLTEIKTIDSFFTYTVLKAMELYSWRIVNNKLLDIKDEDSILEYQNQELVQLAIRRGRTIRINRTLWNSEAFDDYNKVALIFHEAIYSCIIPKEMVFDEDKVYSQSSPRAREVTGYIFTSEIKQGSEAFIRMLGNDFVSRKMIKSIGRKDSEHFGLCRPMENSNLGFRPRFYLDAFHSHYLFLPFSELLEGAESAVKEIEEICKKIRNLGRYPIETAISWLEVDGAHFEEINHQVYVCTEKIMERANWNNSKNQSMKRRPVTIFKKQEEIFGPLNSISKCVTTFTKLVNSQRSFLKEFKWYFE